MKIEIKIFKWGDKLKFIVILLNYIAQKCRKQINYQQTKFVNYFIDNCREYHGFYQF